MKFCQKFWAARSSKASALPKPKHPPNAPSPSTLCCLCAEVDSKLNILRKQAGGCDEGGVFNGTHPFQSCTLMQLPKGVLPYQWQRGPEASTFSSGYVTGVELTYWMAVDPITPTSGSRCSRIPPCSLGTSQVWGCPILYSTLWPLSMSTAPWFRPAVLPARAQTSLTDD